MKPHLVSKLLIAASALSMAASPVALSAAYAQDYDTGDSYYDRGPPSDYDNSEPPPPPPGYEAPPDSTQQHAQDERYARYAEEWAQDNCVKSGGDVAAGAVIGGLFGALVGSAVGGPGHHGGGAAIGAAIGGTSGAAIAASSGGETSPGCPPGYHVRSEAPAFYYEGYGGGPYYYAAPGWYHPWLWYDGHWLYRPYPYHVWYYHHYYRHDRDRDRWDRDRGDRGGWDRR